jgi:hypothetical protein
MAIPYNPQIGFISFCSSAPIDDPVPHKRIKNVSGYAKEAIAQIFKDSIVRTIQCVRDTARLCLKVPIRALYTPIFLSKNWRERERTKINCQLAAYSAFHLVCVPAKTVLALAALVSAVFSKREAHYFLKKSRSLTTYLDGGAARLEALKEEGAKKAPSQRDYHEYKLWLYNIPRDRCIARKKS